MRLRSLTRLLDATQALARPDRIVIIGSSSLLPAHPDLGEVGQPIESSLEPARLRAHYKQTPLGEREAFAAERNLQLVLNETGSVTR
jgi:hypothetical protein